MFHPEAQSGFAGDVFEHRMEVEISDELLKEIPEEKREALLEILAQDPRPGYQREEERIYGIEYGDKNIRFRGTKERLIVTAVDNVRK